MSIFDVGALKLMCIDAGPLAMFCVRVAIAV